MNRRTKVIHFLGILLGTSMSLSMARADVIVERVVRINGLFGLGNVESAEKEYIRGALKREESAGSLAASLGQLSDMVGENRIHTIYRIDKDRVWTLFPSAKSYDEQPIDLRRTDQSGNAASKLEKSDKSTATSRIPDKPGKPASQDRTVRNEIKVNATGNRKTINGFACEQYLVTWTIEMEDSQTKERTTDLMTAEFWNTAESGKVAELKRQETAFFNAYSKKSGLPGEPELINQFGMAMLGLEAVPEEEGIGKLKNIMTKIKGYPIVTKVTWKSEGSAQNRPQYRDESDEEGEDSGDATDADADADADADEMQQQLNGLLSGLADKVGKRSERKTNASGEADSTVVFESYTEVKSIEIGNVDATLFDLPPGYKKIANR